MLGHRLELSVSYSAEEVGVLVLVVMVVVGSVVVMEQGKRVEGVPVSAVSEFPNGSAEVLAKMVACR